MTIYLNKCIPYILIRDLMEQHDVVVIGAGPAGLFCALHAALPWASCPSAGKKP